VLKIRAHLASHLAHATGCAHDATASVAVSYADLDVPALLGLEALLEAVVMVLGSAPPNVAGVATLVTSLPFIGFLIYGGYWLRTGPIPTERYGRISNWTLLGLGFFTAFFALIAVFTVQGWIARISVLRWAVAVGGGIGLLVGIFEARAIENAVATERTKIRNQELERQNERLEAFANIISHDVRNPLNVARGSIALSMEHDDQSRLEQVDSALQRIEAIVEQTLALARSGQTIGDRVWIDLGDIARSAWNNVETDGATLQVDDPPEIYADPERIKQLLENLFRNAIEHGDPTVTVTIGAAPDGFFVEDDGPGIPPDARDDVLTAGYTTAEGGTGFGLAIVHQIVQAHGWELLVGESADGGARFEIHGEDASPAAADESSRSPPVAA
jgi:signal transduction histidine kinase